MTAFLKAGHPVFFKEVCFKEGITSNNADSHKIDNSSEMTIASLEILLVP